MSLAMLWGPVIVSRMGLDERDGGQRGEQI